MYSSNDGGLGLFPLLSLPPRLSPLSFLFSALPTLKASSRTAQCPLCIGLGLLQNCRLGLLLRQSWNCGCHREALRSQNSHYLQGVWDCHVGLRPPRNDDVHKIKCDGLLLLCNNRIYKLSFRTWCGIHFFRIWIPAPRSGRGQVSREWQATNTNVIPYYLEKKKSFLRLCSGWWACRTIVDFFFSRAMYCLVIAWVIIEENHKRDFLQ